MSNLSFTFDDFKSMVYDFFHPTFEGYTNFSFTASEQRMLPIIVFAVFVGVFLAAFYTLYIKSVLGDLVRKLNADAIWEPHKALSLEALGFGKNIFVRQALRNPYSLRRVVRSVESDAFLKENPNKTFRYDPKNEHFYLPEADRYKAEMRFGKRRTAWHTILFTLLCIVICELVIFAVLPELVAYFDRVVSIFSVKGNTVIH